MKIDILGSIFLMLEQIAVALAGIAGVVWHLLAQNVLIVAVLFIFGLIVAVVDWFRA